MVPLVRRCSRYWWKSCLVPGMQGTPQARFSADRYLDRQSPDRSSLKLRLPRTPSPCALPNPLWRLQDFSCLFFLRRSIPLSPASQTRSIEDPAPHRHHHGWQWPLGARAVVCRVSAGHESGVEFGARRHRRVRRRSALRFLTVYAFSTENWRRPPTEVAALFALLEHFIVQEIPTLMKNNAWLRLRAIGRLHELCPRAARPRCDSAIAQTARQYCA